MNPFAAVSLGNPGVNRGLMRLAGPGLLAKTAAGEYEVVSSSARLGVYIADKIGTGLVLFNQSITAISLRDTGSGAFDVSLVCNSSGSGLSVGRTFTIDVQNGDRRLKLAGDITFKNGDMTFLAGSPGGFAYTMPAADATIPGLELSQTWGGINTFTPAARSSGSSPYLTLNAPTDLTLTAGSEAIGVSFVGATRQFASNNNVSTQREYLFGSPTYRFASATSGAGSTQSTIATAITVEISDPVAGTNATLTNKYSLRTAGIIAVGSTPSIKLYPNQPTGNGGWIDLSITGSSGIGSGGPGVNPWIAYASGSGHWFTGTVAGDICYRNTGGKIMIGTSTGFPDLTFAPTGLVGTVSNLEVRGLFSKYKSVSTAGWGVASIYAATRSTAQTVANTSVATYTCGSADGSFEISANVLITTSSGHSFSVTVDYQDEAGTNRTLTLNFTKTTGVITSTIAAADGTIAYTGIPVIIRSGRNQAITIKTAGTFGSCVYNVEGFISQLS